VVEIERGDQQNCAPDAIGGYRTIIEGSLEVKLPTIWTDGKAEVGRVREEKSRREKRKSQKKEDAGSRKGIGKSRDTVFFQ